jgi:CubicO group peptidase (beta-lactamase class C family)
VPTPEALAARLDLLVRREQHDKRFPSLAAAVLRDGEIVWETAVGAADVVHERAATADTQYRIGSITKTFTAAAIMQLRDAGKLDLEDSLDAHLDGVPHTPTLRRLLSHTSGMQRETHDDAWLNSRFAGIPELLETLDRAEQVLPAGARFHYSNLAFALLGVVVERVSGIPYAEYVRTQLLEPAGLTRTTFDPVDPYATGYLVKPYVEDVWDEAPIETGAWIAAGQLWGTVRDLARWAAFLAAPDESVLRAETAREMRTAQTISDHVRWSAGYGLGVQLLRDGDRILAGHGGSMPGFIAGMFHATVDKVGVAVLTNSSTARIGQLALKLVAETVEQWPVPPEPWRVDETVPADVLPLLGIWYLEGDQVVFRWRDGRLEAQFPDAAEWEEPAVFARDADGRWRVASGWEHGEVLRVEPDRLVLAGYPIRREPGTWV